VFIRGAHKLSPVFGFIASYAHAMSPRWLMNPMITNPKMINPKTINPKMINPMMNEGGQT